MHFLLKNALLREVLERSSRKSRRICEIPDPSPGIAIINEIIHKQIFHA